jgi:hypothetical protein
MFNMKKIQQQPAAAPLRIWQTLLPALLLCLLVVTRVSAQFGSDLGKPAMSTLTWDHISSTNEQPSSSISIGLTTDKRMYVWGTNLGFTIHTKMTSTLSSIIQSTVWQVTPFYVPSPAGETVKKVKVKDNNIPNFFGYGLATFFCLTESGKLYGWGINTGLLETAWPIATSLPAPTDTTKAQRSPVQLTILGESDFVDFDASRTGNYWIAIGASGKAYHIGDAGSGATTTFAALPNPAGVTAGTFKYTNVWVSPIKNSTWPFIYLKGNDGKIYFTGRMAAAYSTGVPTLYGRNTPAPVLTPEEAAGQVRNIAPREVPFPSGEDIISMNCQVTDIYNTNYAISASGKAYATGLWRTWFGRSGSPAYTDTRTYVVVPLKSTPVINTEVDGWYINSGEVDSIYILKSFVEVAMPPGASKVLDIESVYTGESGSYNRGTLVVGDNNKTYWSGSNLDRNDVIMTGNYLSVSNEARNLPDICNNIVTAHTNGFNQWLVEAIDYQGARQIERITKDPKQLSIISKSGVGYFVGLLSANSGTGKARTPGDVTSLFPVPIANELLADCNPSPGTGGAGVTASGPAVGTIDCSKTQISPAPVAGSPSQTTLIVSINVTTAGTFTPLTVSGSGMSLGNGVTSVSTTTTGVQTFYIPIQYDGSALTNAFQFTVGSAGSCTADLTQKPNKQVTNVWSLTNCSAITPGVLSK